MPKFKNNSQTSINIGRMVVQPGQIVEGLTELEVNNIRSEIGNLLVEVEEGKKLITEAPLDVPKADKVEEETVAIDVDGDGVADIEVKGKAVKKTNKKTKK